MADAFAEEVDKRLPQFKPRGMPQALVWSRQVADGVFFFIHLAVAEGRDAFTVEIAANNLDQFPWKCLPGTLKELESAMKNETWRFRLPKLYWSLEDEWWTFEIKSWIANEVQLEVQSKVSEAVKRICVYAVPFFEQNASARGLRANLQADRTRLLH